MVRFSSDILSGSLLVDQLKDGSSVHLLCKHKFCIFILHLKIVLLVHHLPHQSSGCCFPYDDVCCISQFSSLRSIFPICQLTKVYSCCYHIIRIFYVPFSFFGVEAAGVLYRGLFRATAKSISIRVAGP